MGCIFISALEIERFLRINCYCSRSSSGVCHIIESVARSWPDNSRSLIFILAFEMCWQAAAVRVKFGKVFGLERGLVVWEVPASLGFTNYSTYTELISSP